MSLREALRRATHGPELHVARTSECNTQLGTPNDATGRATGMQLQPANPRDCSLPGATGGATGTQHTELHAATRWPKLHVASPMPRNTQLDPAATLAEAVRRCCRLRGDTAEHVDALVADCLRQSPEDQADLLAHFVIEAARWRKATGQQ
jgi:hypothetical protein